MVKINNKDHSIEILSGVAVQVAVRSSHTQCNNKNDH